MALFCTHPTFDTQTGAPIFNRAFIYICVTKPLIRMNVQTALQRSLLIDAEKIASIKTIANETGIPYSFLCKMKRQKVFSLQYLARVVIWLESQKPL